jgi:hypothetical protein
MLSNIKSAKMLGLMNHWGHTIERLRAIEIDVSAKFRVLRVWAIIIGKLSSPIENDLGLTANDCVMQEMPLGRWHLLSR